MSKGQVLVAEHNGASILKLVGEVRLTFSMGINFFIDNILTKSNFSGVVIDLTEADFLDSTTLGMLVKLAKRASLRLKKKPLLYHTSEDVDYLLSSMGCEGLFHVVNEDLSDITILDEITCDEDDENGVKDCIIEAHKELMSLNAHNKLEFRALVDMLEMPAQKKLSRLA
jgi:anti-anti-sigma factor